MISKKAFPDKTIPNIKTRLIARDIPPDIAKSNRIDS